MNKVCIFKTPFDSKEKSKIIEKFALKERIKSCRVDIYENEEMRVSIEKVITRVLIYDGNNTNLLERLREFFYGEEYSKL